MPILAVAAGFEELAHSLLLALALEDQSQRSAEVALALFPAVRTVQLAHVVPDECNGRLEARRCLSCGERIGTCPR